MIDRATTTVIVEQVRLAWQQTQRFGDKRGSPDRNGVQGLAGEQEIADQNPKDGGRGQIGSATRQVGQVPVEQTR